MSLSFQRSHLLEGTPAALPPPIASLLSISQKTSALGPSYQLHGAEKCIGDVFLGMRGTQQELGTRGLIAIILAAPTEHLLPGTLQVSSVFLLSWRRIIVIFTLYEQMAAQKKLAQVRRAGDEKPMGSSFTPSWLPRGPWFSPTEPGAHPPEELAEPVNHWGPEDWGRGSPLTCLHF